MSKALIIVDMQRDFMPDGVLPVKDGYKVAPNIVREAYSGYDLVVATRDFHPQSHISFKELGGEWPMHCIAGTEGAQILPEIDMVADVIVSKGTDSNKEAYSGFEGTRLLEVLPEDVEEVVICGVATDYCVLNTAMDARTLLADDVIVSVLLDCIAGVEEETTGDALIEMEDHGINLRFRG